MSDHELCDGRLEAEPAICWILLVGMSSNLVYHINIVIFIMCLVKSLPLPKFRSIIFGELLDLAKLVRHL